MTKQIEDVLNLPRLEDALKEMGVDVHADQVEVNDAEVEKFSRALENGHALEASLRDPDGTIEHAAEMDTIYDAAMRAHKDTLDVGFNVEAKHASSYLGPSATFLDLALKAANSKNDSRLKALKLRMEREKLDHDLKKNQEEGVIEGETPVPGKPMDRNELMKSIRTQPK